MPRARDVAAFILKEYGRPMTAMKLQKLVYYSQAWSLVWDEVPLFPEPIEAWANGPVVRDLFDAHRGQFWVESIPDGDPNTLNDVQKETVQIVLRDYGDKPGQWLADLTHMEDPWKNARRGLPRNSRSNIVIQLGEIHRYYEGLIAEQE